MRSNTPLNDEDRAPWLARLVELLRGHLVASERENRVASSQGDHSEAVSQDGVDDPERKDADAGFSGQDHRMVAVLACSALRKAYRDTFRDGLGEQHVRFIHLHGSKDVILRRLMRRKAASAHGNGPEHFMPVTLLDSQFAALDVVHGEELDMIPVTITMSVDDIVVYVSKQLQGAS
eukprot:jgi/Mesvir1/28768/Mv19733-RA.1